MNITDYTSYSEIRSTCGLSSDELPDTVLALELYQNTLAIGLRAVNLPGEAPGPGPLASRFLVIKAIVEASRTAKEQELYELTRMMSTYTVALEVMRALSMKAAKTVSDSKTTLTRFSPESVYKLAIENIEAKLGELIGMIEDINDTEDEVLSFLALISPDFDPVTGA